MASGGQQVELPWWQKYLARGVGCGGGVIALGLGLFNCISFSAWCIVGGIWQMVAAFIVISAEAPCCCMFVDFVQRYSMWVDSRPHWQKSVFYVVLAIPPFTMCFSVSIFLGSGLIFLCGVLYGLMALGKKGSREDMIAAAQNSGRPGGMKDNLVDGGSSPPA
ncbi:calcium channel flower-like isoform X2 [Portunus trituberculatus]|uniref:calcium channel flower-like isoform X2 n=1 Tax=Portunus trituberculatus TaxID=210409 RepID=UPI001E1CDCDB|nr:calcium channel flower-like isoform X2 [Portunus trituberculatus]